ncbi:MAG: hypothetical protein EHM28_11010 [Spirochaetaceae bacterium]|nr:MAG: hypothetical protein EHM28_11010 [Spirochaetaceae bacterium]
MRDIACRIATAIISIAFFSFCFSGCASVGIAVPSSYGAFLSEEKAGFAIKYYDIDYIQAKRISDTISNVMAFYRTNFADTELRKFTVYVYHTQEDLVHGLVACGGLSYESARRFARSGAPRPLKGLFHVPITLDLRTIAHETMHMYVEAVSGSAYQRIKWLDEGLGEYMSYLFWKQASPDSAVTAKINEYNAFLSQNRDRFISLDRICAESQWTGLNTGSTSSLIYHQAFLVVGMLAKQDGLEKIKQVLVAVRDGMAAETACQSVLSRSQADIYEELVNLEKVDGLL